MKKRKILILLNTGSGWRLLPLELVNETTRRNAKAAGYRIASKVDVKDLSFTNVYKYRGIADDAAYRQGCNTITYQKLAHLAKHEVYEPLGDSGQV